MPKHVPGGGITTHEKNKQTNEQELSCISLVRYNLRTKETTTIVKPLTVIKFLVVVVF